MKQSKTLYKTLISEYTRRIAEMKDNLPLIEDVKEEAETRIKIQDLTEKLDSLTDFWQDAEKELTIEQ